MLSSLNFNSVKQRINISLNYLQLLCREMIKKVFDFPKKLLHTILSSFGLPSNDFGHSMVCFIKEGAYKIKRFF